MRGRRRLSWGTAALLLAAAASVPAPAAPPAPWVWTWGDNCYDGALGRADSTPPPAYSIAGSIALSGGDAFTLALTSSGEVWGWGQNLTGQLGNGSSQNARTAPVKANVSGVTGIATGSHHSLALRSDGAVWAWGSNYSGQVGYSTAPSVKSQNPTPVPGMTSMVAVAAGEEHSLALRSDGTVWTWGNDQYGQMGFPTTAPHQVSELAGVTSIAAGGFSSFAVTADGSVWGWGADSSGQLGDGATADAVRTPVLAAGIGSPVQIEAGRNHTIARLGDGSVWAWGDNTWGQFGDGTTSSSLTPVRIEAFAGARALDAFRNQSLALAPDGTVLQTGSTGYSSGYGTGTPFRIPRIRSATAVSEGLCADAALAPAPAAAITTPDGALMRLPANVAGTAPANAPVRVYEGPTLVATATADGSGAWTTSFFLPDGTHALTASALVDGVETSESSARKIVIDSMAPQAPAITSPAQGARAGNPATIAGTGEPGSRVDVYEGGVRKGGGTASSAGDWTSSVPLATGDHTLTATATDAAGNVSAVSAASTFWVDGTAAVISFARPVAAVYYNDQEIRRAGSRPVIVGPFTVDVQITDPETGIASVLIYTLGRRVDPSEITISGSHYRFTFHADSPGNHTIDVYARNGVDTLSVKSVTVLAVP